MDTFPLLNSERFRVPSGIVHSGESLGGKHYAICGPVFSANALVFSDYPPAERTLEPVTCLRCLVRELRALHG